MKRFFVVTLAIVLALSLSGLVLAENAATVNQDGDRNATAVEQELGVNTVRVNQDGYDNLTSVRQGGGPDSTDRPSTTWAYVDQDGYRNEAVVDQHGAHYDGHTHTLYIYQHGNDNYANIKQASVFHGAWASIDQSGYGNSAGIDQVGNSYTKEKGAAGTTSYAVIRQQDNDNYAYQLQRAFYTGGNFIRALIDQKGTANIATQEQQYRDVGLVGLEAYAYQDGFKNESVQVQQKGYGARHGEVVQTGNRNYAAQTQEAGNQVAFIGQVGNDNWAVVNQLNKVSTAK